MSDPWFGEQTIGTWTLAVPDAEIEALDAAMVGLARRIGAADTPDLVIELADGGAYDHAEVTAIANESIDIVGEAIRRDQLDDDAFARMVAAVTNLQVIAITAAQALAEVRPADEADVMGLAAILSRLLEQAFGALDRSISVTDSGRYSLRWSPADRAMVRMLAADLDASLDGDDPSIVRLFPPAYGVDETKSREFDAIARHELITSRRAALAVVEEAIDADELEADQLAALMRAVNDLRLVLGTQLDVSEGDVGRRRVRGPEGERWRAYERLTGLLGQIVAALEG